MCTCHESAPVSSPRGPGDWASHGRARSWSRLVKAAASWRSRRECRWIGAAVGVELASQESRQELPIKT